MLISFIIPAYNAAPYIERCLANIQPLLKDENELIIIDDGSTDKTLALIQQFAQGKPHVHILIQPHNTGQSAARNRGIQVAKGDYLWFIDADDYIDPTIASIIIEEARNRQYDAICFGLILEDGKNAIKNPPLTPCVYQTGLEYFQKSIKQGTFRTYPVNKLMRRSVFAMHKIQFVEGRIYEDMLLNLLFFLQCKSVKELPIYPYHYILYNTNSTTHKNRIRKKDLDALWFTDHAASLLANHPLGITPSNGAFLILVFSFLSSCILKKYIPLTSQNAEAQMMVDTVIKNTLFKKATKYCATHYVGFSRTIMATLICISPRLYQHAVRWALKFT